MDSNLPNINTKIFQFQTMINNEKYDIELFYNQNMTEISISNYNDFLYQEWNIQTCLDILEQDIKTVLWKSIYKKDKKMFNKLVLMFNSHKCENKLFKCTKTDDDNIKVDFYPKIELKKALPIRLILKK